MSEDFLFTDGTNPSALLDILDEDEADVNTSFDVDKILAKFIVPTPKSCNYDRSRLEKKNNQAQNICKSIYSNVGTCATNVHWSSKTEQKHCSNFIKTTSFNYVWWM